MIASIRLRFHRCVCSVFQRADGADCGRGRTLGILFRTGHGS